MDAGGVAHVVGSGKAVGFAEVLLGRFAAAGGLFEVADVEEGVEHCRRAAAARGVHHLGGGAFAGEEGVDLHHAGAGVG